MTVIVNVSIANSTLIVWSALTAGKVYSSLPVISTATSSTLTTFTWYPVAGAKVNLGVAL